MPDEPLMVTSSLDNSLKLWIFDMPDLGARLLRIREGHSAPPQMIRYHGANGHNILSAGSDSSLRIFNTQTERFNKSLGRASYNRKASKRRNRTEADPLQMPPIVQFTSEITREKEWDNIASIHLGLSVVTTWSYDKLKMGDLKMVPERFQGKHKPLDLNVSASCICLTHCGNFVLVGYTTGHLDRFNIQSGIHRGSYGGIAHNGSVRGVAVDGLNKIIVTGGSDQHIRFWNFKGTTDKAIQVIRLNESVAFMRSGPGDSSLICVALDDYSCIILDMDSKEIVRKIGRHEGQLTDVTFSPDARWLVTAGMDCVIKTWNIPSAQLVDQFKVNLHWRAKNLDHP